MESINISWRNLENIKWNLKIGSHVNYIFVIMPFRSVSADKLLSPFIIYHLAKSI